jgi:hypothetical protein
LGGDIYGTWQSIDFGVDEDMRTALFQDGQATSVRRGQKNQIDQMDRPRGEIIGGKGVVLNVG